MTFDAPIICPPAQVESDWIDYNGHMNMAFYNVVFDRGLDAIFDLLGVGEAYARTGGSCFTVEAHVTYIQELNEHDPLRVEYQLLGYDTKRIHSLSACTTQRKAISQQHQNRCRCMSAWQRAAQVPSLMRRKANLQR